MTWPSPYQNGIREIRSLSNFKGEKKGNKRIALCAILLMSPRIYKCLGVKDPLLRNGPVHNQNNNRWLLNREDLTLPYQRIA